MSGIPISKISLNLIFILMAVGTMLQAAAINFSSFSLGIPVISVLVFSVILFFFRTELVMKLVISRFEASYLKYLLPFVIYAIGSAFFFPALFKGLLVYVPRLGIGYVPTGYLEFSISNLAEVIYLILNFSLLVVSLRLIERDNHAIANSMFEILGFIALFFTYYQFLSNLFHFYYPTDIINSNKSFDQGFNQTTGFTLRLSGLFTEPSLNGNFLGTFFVYFLTRSIWSHKQKDVAFAGIFLVATLLITSSLGYIEIVFGLGIYLFFAFIEIIRKKRVKYVFFIVLLFLFISLYALAIFFQRDITVALLDKDTSGSYLERSGADNYAYGLLIRTWGLGVGLGSNRPSGMLPYLLSNVGVIGTLLFVLFIFKLLMPLRVLNRGNADQKAMLFGVIAFLLGKYFGAPDIAFQYVWLILAVGGAQAMAVARETNPVSKREPKSQVAATYVVRRGM